MYSGSAGERGSRQLLAIDLSRALDAGELAVLYQPKFECNGGRVAGAEALVRWQHPRFGLVPAEHLIEIAEQSGIIHRLGRWVLDRACSQLKEWRDLDEQAWTIAVNVSVLQLQCPEFCDEVRAALRRYSLPPERLILEITESFAMQHLSACMESLCDLYADSVQISLDDFGCGFSSLARMKRLPLAEVKIDKSFVNEIDKSEVDADICSTIITLGGILGLRVVAEGVERREQLLVLERLGCDQVQGYLHGPSVAGSMFHAVYGRCKSSSFAPVQKAERTCHNG
ncbi:putative bifunctional diguanylate cyclase/phosphodiesterase [Stenotrophomonas maltophilia]|uniref:putative bifunctional diguanylate cyclase/phosphodiesterase n=1 Tax=Stenotrophomonas maltophilia TaxID=40324 RepID=UPI0018D48183|nr:EAL domain-containing protein [Stenotrophomonas geniculata]MBH1637630.1 EAL domain-containing protein [Stenotrophomonas maltophilia]HEL7750729.1 EAL domain-containing protein [Stenotrophomonas maltophilia]